MTAMTWGTGSLIAVVGLWAGLINAVVGSGTLVSFPVLVALGYPPVTATTSNTIGLITGTITGAVGYRKELTGQRRRLLRYGITMALGSAGGTALLLSLPAEAFEAVVPGLVGLAVLLVIVGPVLSRRLAGRSGGASPTAERWLPLPLGLVGAYGGYFTAAHGIMMVGVMGLFLPDPLQRLNAFRNTLSVVVNVVAGVIYAVLAPVDWAVVGVLAASSVLGGALGARIGRRLSPTVLRGLIVVIGVAAIVHLLAT